MDPATLILLVTSSFSTFLVFALFWRQRVEDRRRREIDDLLRSQQVDVRAALDWAPTTSGDDLVYEKPAPIPPIPEPPRELVSALRAGEVVLYAGEGVAASAGYPTWAEAVATVIEQRDALDPSGDWGRLARSSSDQAMEVADVVSARLPTAELRGLLARSYVDTGLTDSALVEELSKLPFRSVITRNWDSTLEAAFAPKEPRVLTLEDGDAFAQAVRSKSFVILKLHGTLDSDRGFFFNTDDFRRALYQNTSAAATMTSLFLSDTIFFVGADTDTIAAFAEALPTSVSRKPKSHFALVPWTPGFALSAERLRAKYGIELLPYVDDPGQSGVARFLRRLGNAVAGSDPSARTEGPSYITDLELVNIGPFGRLELTFQPGWNVILGDNGSGKSTVLRALALAVAGDDSRLDNLGGRLLRAGQSRGSVEVRAGRDVYQSQLLREAVRVAVRAARPTALQAGAWTVIAFPSVRGVSKGDSPPVVRDIVNPVVEDVLPMLGRGSDERLDDIKQWLLRLSLDAEDRPDLNPAVAARARSLRSSFFEVLAAFTQELTLEFSRIDRPTWQVLVRTDDGEVSLDLVSQGTSSIVGWIGTVLQRLYEIHPDSAHPKQEAAIVLIDEIDAHMHPGWQKALVPLLKKWFPRLQVIATTHSPLIVGAMAEDEVIRLRRGPDGIEPVGIGEPLRGLRSDQILTSAAFDLESTRDADTDRLLTQYTKLLAIGKRSKEEQAEFDALAGRVRNLPGVEATPAQRRQMKDLERDVEAVRAALPRDRQVQIFDAMAELLEENPNRREKG
jgi:energy-coupling factor transporter ATP-binding protein EcfA2